MQTIACETRLIERAKHGCAESFRELVETNHRTLRLFISRFIHCPETIDDIAQEVFLHAYRDLYRFRGKSKFSTWLLGIARLKSLEFLRAERKSDRVKHDVAFANELEARFVELQKSNLTFRSIDERLEALSDCIGELPEQSMSLIKECYFENLSCEKIAFKTQCKSGTIRMKLLRIRKILRKCVERKTGRQGP